MSGTVKASGGTVNGVHVSYTLKNIADGQSMYFYAQSSTLPPPTPEFVKQNQMTTALQEYSGSQYVGVGNNIVSNMDMYVAVGKLIFTSCIHGFVRFHLRDGGVTHPDF